MHNVFMTLIKHKNWFSFYITSRFADILEFFQIWSWWTNEHWWWYLPC